jgi:hypothetical protein
VAVEYAHRHLAKVGLAWQFPAEDLTLLLVEFARLAAQLGAREMVDARDPVASVQGVLAAFPSSWLVAFDNADGQEALCRFVPPAGRGRVLITTRRSVSHYLLKLSRYWTDAEVAAAWERGHAGSLGWLLSLTAAVLERMGRIAQPRGNSLADFAWVLAALDSLWGTRSLELWRGGQAELYAELAEGDPVAMAVRVPWGGKAADPLELMKNAGVLAGAPPGRPWTPNGSAGRWTGLRRHWRR